MQEAYDPQTQSLTDVRTTDSLDQNVVDDTAYDYGNPDVSERAGLLVSTTDQQESGATSDTRCFGYDYADRISSAWTATDQCAATPSAGSSASVGGPNPYWQSWTYDAAGDRLGQTDHDTGGTTANDTTTTYAYGSPNQPHTVSGTTATGPQADADTASYGYDAAGETAVVDGGALGHQALTWNDQGKLATDTTGGGVTGYVYDTDGNLLVRRDPGQTTLYVGDEEIVLDTKTNTASATRYYTVGGVMIAARTSGANPQYLIPDQQGTDQLAIDAVNTAVTRRQYLPFGQARGPLPASWAGGDKGYVGGNADVATGLENLGAREYDPVNGRFLSRDPKFESNDPNQLDGYDYAGNDPVTGSDPTGLNWFSDAIGGIGTGLATVNNGINSAYHALTNNPVAKFISDNRTTILGALSTTCLFIPFLQPLGLVLGVATMASGGIDMAKDIHNGDGWSAALDGIGIITEGVGLGFAAAALKSTLKGADLALKATNPDLSYLQRISVQQELRENPELIESHNTHSNLATVFGAAATAVSTNRNYSSFIGPIAPNSPMAHNQAPPAPPEAVRGRYVAF